MQVVHRSDGFVVKREDRLELSEHSALSGTRLNPGALTIPVPGLPGVFYRLTPGEAVSLTDEQREKIVARAFELFSPAGPGKSKSDKAEQ